MDAELRKAPVPIVFGDGIEIRNAKKAPLASRVALFRCDDSRAAFCKLGIANLNATFVAIVFSMSR